MSNFMIQSNLACSFSPTCLQCLVWETVSELYTQSCPLIGGLTPGLILGRCDNRYYVRGCPSSRLYHGNTVSADVRAISYIGVPLAILFVHLTSRMKLELQQLRPPIGAAVGTISTVLFYGTYHELALATLVGKLGEELQKNSLQLTGFTHGSLTLFSFLPTMIVTKYG